MSHGCHTHPQPHTRHHDAHTLLAGQRSRRSRWGGRVDTLAVICDRSPLSLTQCADLLLEKQICFLNDVFAFCNNKFVF